MPLKCLSPAGPVYAFDYDREQFERLRQEHAARQHLRFSCCESPVGLRVSSTGLPHFYHFRRAGDCRYETESEMHLRIKQQVALAALAAGWKAETEARGQEYAGGDDWTADVLVQRRNVRIAFEVQLSGQTWADTLARQARYKASGVRGLWFFATRNYDASEAVPAFQIRKVGDTQFFEVRVTPPGRAAFCGVRAIRELWVALPEFVAGALAGGLHWAPALKEGMADALLRVKNPLPCVCGVALCLPVGCAISLSIPGHHALVWSLMQRGLKTVGPKWLNSLVAYANDQGDSFPRVAFRDREDRYTCRYRCPVCSGLFKDVLTPHPERTLSLMRVPLEALGPAIPDSPESLFLNRWWLSVPLTELAS